jgi:hypothetical protein
MKILSYLLVAIIAYISCIGYGMNTTEGTNSRLHNNTDANATNSTKPGCGIFFLLCGILN